MSFFQGIRNALHKIVPRWLSRRPQTTQRPVGFEFGFRYLWMIATTADVFLELTIEGIFSWFPGYTLGDTSQLLDPSTALPLIGRSRGIMRGEADTDASFAARLPHWLEDWEGAGSSEVLAKEIQAYLGNTPMVRIVDRAGNWVTRASDGTVTKVNAAWNWDSVSNPERAGYWSDLWIIVYPCEWPVTGATLASLVGAWGTYQGVGTGHAVPRAAVDAILNLVETWKGAHTWCVAILWSYDATLFVPGSPVAGDPDGTWGGWSKNVGGTQVPARLNDGRVRFWIPAQG